MRHDTDARAVAGKGWNLTEPTEPPDGPRPDEVRERAQAFFEAAAAYQSRMLEASSGYNQIVVLGGYAGFFTIWSATAAELPRWLVLVSGALMGLSLIVYVGWTVYGMVLRSNFMQRMMGEIKKGPDGFLARVQAAEAEGAIAVAHYMRFWKPILWTACAPALIAALLVAAGAFCVVASSAGERPLPPTAAAPAIEA